MFDAYTLDTVPDAARPALREATNRMGGRVPDAAARLARSPELLNGFLSLSASFENCTLDPLARETVIMVMATRNDCHICIAIHTGKLRQLDADADLIKALREQRALGDPRLEAVREFTLAVLTTAGRPGDDAVAAFLAHGYTERNALEVVLGIGTYTMSTLANRLVGAA